MDLSILILHTNFIDSSGIGLVLGRYNQLKLDDRQLYLANLSKTSYKVLNYQECLI